MTQPERDAMGRFLRPPDNVRRTGRKPAISKELLENIIYTYPPPTIVELVVKAEMAADNGDAKVSGAYLAIARFLTERVAGKPPTNGLPSDGSIGQLLEGFLADDNSGDSEGDEG